MLISINNPVLSTNIFLAILIIALLTSIRRKQPDGLLSPSTSQELKGLAILMVIFSHIGLFLVTDRNFLYPLTIAAGVGVNLFLFLSGYGLMFSALKKQLSVWEFYRRRLVKLYIPIWIVLIVFFLLDFFVLKINYSWGYMGKTLLGYIPRADLYLDVNSPLWFVTFILFYYFLFPLLFVRRAPWLSALAIYFVTYYIVQWNPDQLNQVMHLYKVHIMAFPLGMIIGNLFYKLQASPAEAGKIVTYLKMIGGRIKALPKAVKLSAYWLLLAGFISLALYTIYYSGVGTLNEENISIITVLAITSVFIMKRWEIKLLYLVGVLSYEAYLLHWPLMYRYDLFYKALPAWLATALYLVLFLILGWVVQKISALISKKIE